MLRLATSLLDVTTVSSATDATLPSGENEPVIVAKLLAAAGGVVGAVSVISGLAGEGGTAPYAERFAFAGLALVLAIVAGVVPWWPRLEARTAGTIVFPAGLIGFLATQLWFINTYYEFALPLWLIASAVLVAARRVAR
jgi:hypothetical protein